MSQSFSARGVSAPLVEVLDSLGISSPEQELEVSRLAGRLGHAGAFAASGISGRGPVRSTRTRRQQSHNRRRAR